MNETAGGGGATGINGEGYWLQQADVASIVRKVFDVNSGTPGTPIATPSVSVSSAISDTPQTWNLDSAGWNFAHNLAASNFPAGGHWYRVEYTVTTTGGRIMHAIFNGEATDIRSN